MISSPSPTATMSTSGLRNQSGSREASWPPIEQRRSRQLAAHLAGEAHHAEALGGEVALEADHLRREGAQLLQAARHAVEAQIDDLALVAFLLEAAGHALEAERLDEGDHLETDDAADGRLEERNLHGGQILSRLAERGDVGPRGGQTGRMAAAPVQSPATRSRTPAV